MKTFKGLLGLFSLVVLFTMSAKADVVYNFSGSCIDCTGTVNADLTTTDGGAFVSFAYGGSDLVSAFTVTPGDVTSYSGIPSGGGPLPGYENFTLAFTGFSNGYFNTDTAGIWCLAVSSCTPGGSDNGNFGTWSKVPEPGSLALWGSGLLGFAGLVRRKVWL